MTSESVLKVKFQFRMTEEERKMLEEITQRQWPEIENAHSLMLRRLIRAEHSRQMKRKDVRAWAADEKDMQRIANDWASYDRDPPGS